MKIVGTFVSETSHYQWYGTFAEANPIHGKLWEVLNGTIKWVAESH